MPKKVNPKRPKNAKPAKTKLVKAPVIQSRVVRTRIPVVNRRMNSITIKHAEFFTAVNSPAGVAGGFTVQTYAINPGNISMFPWLATQAAGWERYRFKRLTFRYIPRCATTQGGTLVLAPDYDAADDPPTTEIVACSYSDAVSGMPWAELVLTLRNEAMAGGVTSKYVRQGALKANLDVKTYDCGQLFIGIDQTVAAANYWGKLWVDYEVELITPHTIPPANTSTHAGVSDFGLLSPYPVVKASGQGTTVETAGPIDITTKTVTTGAGTLEGIGWDINGLVAGARYLAQILLESDTAGTFTATASPVVTGLTKIADTISYPYTYTTIGAGKKSIMGEIIYQAADRIASVVPSFSWPVDVFARGTQLILSPIVTDPAWTLL